MAGRASSIAVVVLVLATAGTGAATTRPLVTTGYPYARDCPAAGRRDDVDRWRMDTCNCTSYVAWALAVNGYRTDWFVAGAMDAWNWPNVARRAHLVVGTEPRTGAVAVWPRWGRFGHLALVTAVDSDGTFEVAEYNLPGGLRFRFDRRSGVHAGRVSFIYVTRR